MKKQRLLFFAWFCACFLGVPAYSQGGFIPQQTALKTVNGTTSPIANATITVCAGAVGGIPCSPALVGATFKDAALTQPLANPFTSDANGNFQFAIAPGTYTVTVTAAGFLGNSSQVTVQCPVTSSCTATFSSVKAGGFISSNGNPAVSGVLRLASTDAIAWRNNANGADILLQKTGAASSAAAADTLDLSGFGSVKTAGIIGSGYQKQIFTSSGTFTIPTGITQVKVTVLGDGGGGAGTNGGGGTGGGAGAVAVKWLTGLTPGNTLTVTVGAGGSGGASGAHGGSNGTGSSVASGTQTISTITANGGQGGNTGNSASPVVATASGGDINIPGSTAMATVSTAGGVNTNGQSGAPSAFGGMGTTGIGAGGNGTFGSGGSSGGATNAGGNGGAGIVIFEWIS